MAFDGILNIIYHAILLFQYIYILQCHFVTYVNNAPSHNDFAVCKSNTKELKTKNKSSKHYKIIIILTFISYVTIFSDYFIIMNYFRWRFGIHLINFTVVTYIVNYKQVNKPKFIYLKFHLHLPLYILIL